MSERFADGVPRLAALSAQTLGWRPAEFWLATPAELAMSFADPSARAERPLSRTEFEHMMERESDG